MNTRIAVSARGAAARGAAARVALLQDGVLTRYHLWNLESPCDIGALYTGRVTSAAPAMAGKFVDLGTETGGFLPDTAGGRALTEGQYAVFKITRAAQGGKGVRLAHVPDQNPADKPGLLRAGPGPLLELAEMFSAVPITLDDYALMAQLRPALAPRMTFQTAAFSSTLEEEIAELFEPACKLPNGAILHFEFTRALTCIDIDTGAATAARGAQKPQAQLAFNLALLPALVRQIVLRNLSGGILVDFAGLKSAARPKLTAPLRSALDADPLKPKFLGFSHLGYAELSRPRLRPPLHELLLP